LYAKEAFKNIMTPSSRPKILNGDAKFCILTLPSLGQRNMINFDWLARPESEGLFRSTAD
jgi:hypothetical protein